MSRKGVLDMAHTVNVNIKMDEDVKKRMERACARWAFPWVRPLLCSQRKSAESNRIPFEVSADPFYSESNMNYLRRVISDIESRKAVLKEHELIEDWYMRLLWEEQAWGWLIAIRSKTQDKKDAENG